MFKRILAFLCALMLLCSMGVLAAEADNLLQNADFEMVNADGTATGWMNIGDGAVFAASKLLKKDGEYALHINTQTGNAYAAQEVTHIVGGEEYVLTGSVFVAPGTTVKPMLKMEFYDAVGKEKKYLGGEDFKIKYKENTWSEFSFKLAVPEDAFAISVLLRAFGDGVADLYFDGVALAGKRADGYVETPLVPTTTVKPQASPDVEVTYEEPTEAKIPYNEASAREFLKNGDFEKLDEHQSVANWKLLKGALGKDFILETDNPPSGEKYIRLKPTGEDHIYIQQTLYGIVGLAEYHISVMVRTDEIKKGRYPTIKMEFSSAKGYVGSKTIYKTDAKVGGGWEEWNISFIAPAETNRVAFLLRIMTAAGNLAYDKASFKGPHAGDNPPVVNPSAFPPVNFKAPAAGEQEMLVNGDFEALGANGTPENWEGYKSWENEFVTVEHEITHSGNTAIKISTDSDNNPWVRQKVENVIPGMEYQASYWIRASYLSGMGFAFKFEWHDANGTYMETELSDQVVGYVSLTTGEHWYHFVQTIEPPLGAASVMIYPRLYGAGTIYIDDVSFYRSGEAERFNIDLDEYFCYTDNESNHAYATPNLVFYPELATGYANFRLMDGETVLREVTGVPVMAGKARFKFYTADLIEKQKPYTVEATLFDANGASCGTKKEVVYRYDRPTVLDKDGNYIMNGEIFHPVFAYHVDPKYYPRMKELGVNVIQGQSTKETLDAAWENGLYVLAQLYNSVDGVLSAAGSDALVERTRERVTNLKDHPALYGWMIMDEPYNNDRDPLPELRNSYIEVRNIDPVHPVYSVEDGENFAQVSKCVDLFAIDPYPRGQHNPATFVAERGVGAKAGGLGVKPVYNVIQMFLYGGYYPTDDELRSMFYQVFLAGGHALGVYEIDQTLAGKPVFEVEGTYNTFKAWAEKELDDTYDFFIDRDYPVFNEQKTADVWSISYPKDGKLRVIALNQHTDKEATLTLPLVSTNQSVQIGAFTGVVYAGGAEQNFSGDGTFTATIQPGGAVVYEITPVQPVDFSGLPISKFRDLANHAWARAAIEELEQKNIVYGYTADFYAPGYEITRGEFASFLVRALGITPGGAEQFTDVYAGDTYAADIAAGKAAGILQGMGDGRFCPDRLITRQDMMTMVARGLALTGNADLSAFADNSSIADYARPHAAAMIDSGLIKGNADGTLNPLGYTTRAESAVLMQRITER